MYAIRSYYAIAQLQEDKNLKAVLTSLSDIEKGHANAILKKINAIDPNFKMIPPSGSYNFV